MLLSRMRIKARSYKHWMSRLLPEPISPTELENLVIRLRQGDLSVANTIIQGHLRIASQIVGRYLTRSGLLRKSNDLVSESFLAVAEAVSMAKENMYDNNITPYIIATVHSYLDRFLCNDHCVRVPDSTFRKYKGKRRPPSRSEDSTEQIAEAGFLNSVILRDMIDKACTGTVDREIVRLRLKGLSDREVGAILCYSPQRIAQLRTAIEKRFLEIEKGAKNDLARRV